MTFTSYAVNVTRATYVNATLQILFCLNVALQTVRFEKKRQETFVYVLRTKDLLTRDSDSGTLVRPETPVAGLW